MPPGHLLVQAGKQLEYARSVAIFYVMSWTDVKFFDRHLTGGLILAGFHEGKSRSSVYKASLSHSVLMYTCE